MITSIDIHPGVHPTFTVGSLVFNRDTVTSTVVAAAVVLALGFYLRSKVTSEVPGKLQLAWEGLVNWVNGLVEDNLGKLNPFVVPLAVALFVFILVANRLEAIPTDEKVPPPTADTNLTYALAIIVIIGVHIYAVRKRGFKDYVKGYGQPFLVMAPLTILEEIIKPFTLALRLFGNIFAGGIMVALIGGLIAWKIGEIPVGGALFFPFAILWKIFDMAIGFIQAFIFSLLTILYFGMAGEGHGGHDESHDQHESEDALKAA